MAASIGSGVIVGMAAMVLASTILLWGVSHVMWRSEPRRTPFRDRRKTHKQRASGPNPVPVAVPSHPGRRQMKAD